MKNYIKIFLLSVFTAAACTQVQIPEIPVASMLMSEEELTLTMGKTFELSVTMLPEDATDKNVVWHSTKESVATVSPDGLVTAVGHGTSYIIATNSASSLTAACMVTVKMNFFDIVVSEVGGNQISQPVFGYPGMTLNLVATSTDGDEHFYTWTSSAPDFVSVQNGSLTWGNAFAEDTQAGYILYGEAQIEVMAEDGTSTSFTAVNNVLSSFELNNVSRPVESEVRFDPSESRTVQIFAKTNDGKAALPASLYTLESSDNSVVKVAAESGEWKISALTTNGTADVTLTIYGKSIKLATIKVEEHIEEPDKEFGSGNTEKFPVDDDIDWVVEPEENLIKNN